LSGIACRLFTAYGERENETHAVVALIAKAVCRWDPYPIWGDGLQTRNFTYVQDTATGMALAGAELSGFETINVGTGAHDTIDALIGEIFRALDYSPKQIARQLDKPVGVKSRAADLSKCRARLAWEPEVSLAQGIAKTAGWYARTFGDSRRRELERLLMERG